VQESLRRALAAWLLTESRVPVRIKHLRIAADYLPVCRVLSSRKGNRSKRRGIDGKAANDDGPKSHEFENVIEHPQYLPFLRN
jgi:hypothetical protein